MEVLRTSGILLQRHLRHLFHFEAGEAKLFDDLSEHEVCHINELKSYIKDDTEVDEKLSRLLTLDTALFDRIISPTEHYEHNVTHPDVNGHAHVRAGLLGPSLVFPFEEGELCLGRWQEICFVCFDNRPRERTVIVQTLGVA